MKKNQSGFTLIELVVVIVILGILAAVAVPKFINMKDDAQAAAIQGVKGAIESSSAINYASRSANANKGVATADGTLTCQTAAVALLQGGLPTGYSLDDTVVTAAASDAKPVNVCTLTLKDYAPTVPVVANIIGIK